MNGTQATFTMVLLFALRCVVPLAVVMGIGYAMNWLVDRWEAEAAVPTQKADRCWPSNNVMKHHAKSAQALPSKWHPAG